MVESKCQIKRAGGRKKEGKRSEEETIGTAFLPAKGTGQKKVSFLS